MAIIDTFAYLEEFLVVLDCFLILLDIVIEDTDRIVSSTFIPNFPSSPTPKSQHLVIFKSSLHGDIGPIINFLGIESIIILCLIDHFLLLHKSARGVEKEWQLDTMGH